MDRIHGRDPQVWRDFIDAATKSLKRTARLHRDTNYTDLNREIVAATGHPGFDFASADERSAMGDLLGDIVEETFDEHEVMLSSLVMYVNENKPGRGFFTLATQMGLLPKDSTAEERDEFWWDQVRSAQNAYGKKTRKFGDRS